jgi:hypothetical protein
MNSMAPRRRARGGLGLGERKVANGERGVVPPDLEEDGPDESRPLLPPDGFDQRLGGYDAGAKCLGG